LFIELHLLNASLAHGRARRNLAAEQSRTFLTLEFLDLMTDAAGYYLTQKEGDLRLANDDDGVVALALLASVGFGALAHSIGTRRNQSIDGSIAGIVGRMVGRRLRRLIRFESVTSDARCD
jgi:hypothetical protein